MSQYSLSEFEEDKYFRADFMFFLLRLNSFFESLFWEKFFCGKPQRRKLRSQVEKFETGYMDKNHPIGDHLKKALLHKDFLSKRPQLDCYAKCFRLLLESLPDDTKKHQENILQQEFGIFLTHNEFLQTIKNFSRKRNDLEHFLESAKWKPKAPKSICDREVIKALGLYLMPQMRGMFMSSMRSAAKRLGRETELKPVIEKTEKLFAETAKKAKENMRLVFAEKRTRENLDKARRKALEAADAEYQHKIWAMCENQEHYRLGTFKNHYHFIGERALQAIGEEIDRVANGAEQTATQRKRITSDKTPDFKYDYEALCFLAVRINLVLYCYVTARLDNEWQAALRQCGSKTKWGDYKKGIKADTQKKIEGKYGDLVKIRDAIAHNGLFWRVSDGSKDGYLAAKDVFTIVLRHINSAETANDFYTKILGLCKKYSRALAFPAAGNNRETAVEVVRTWSPERRRKYKNDNLYKIDKRPYVSGVVANWVTALNTAKAGIDQKI